MFQQMEPGPRIKVCGFQGSKSLSHWDKTTGGKTCQTKLRATIFLVTKLTAARRCCLTKKTETLPWKQLLSRHKRCPACKPHRRYLDSRIIFKSHSLDLSISSGDFGAFTCSRNCRLGQICHIGFKSYSCYNQEESAGKTFNLICTPPSI